MGPISCQDGVESDQEKFDQLQAALLKVSANNCCGMIYNYC